jgi:hypothetical protein
VLAQVNTASDAVLVSTPVGGMRLIDYLPSRIFELAVHTLDIARDRSGSGVTLAG